MTIILVRYSESQIGTRGKLITTDKNGNLKEFHTLEKQWKNNQNQISCIPTGKYPISFEYSPSFKQNLWELKNVPNRNEIKIHPANKESQLLGCIALGKTITPSGIGLSKKAIEEFHSLLNTSANHIIHIVSTNLIPTTIQ